VPVAALAHAVKLAKSNETCDDITGTLPLLGRRMLDALEVVEDALAQYTVAANVYDDFAANAVVTLNVNGLDSARVSHPRYGYPTVDGISVVQGHGDGLLASVVVPALVALHAPAFAIKEHRLLASAAVAPAT
jgi:hypothetical protein